MMRTARRNSLPTSLLLVALLGSPLVACGESEDAGEGAGNRSGVSGAAGSQAGSGGAGATGGWGGASGLGGTAASGGSGVAGGTETGGSGGGGGATGMGGDAGAGGSAGGDAGAGGAGGDGGSGGGIVGPWPPSATFTNPVLWLDLADIDVFRVGDVFYYSASTMAYSPGAPILRSYDLVNWEFVGHSVPSLNFGAKYDFNGGTGYVRGIWASTLRYRESNRTFYWLGCIDFSRTYVFTATNVEGPWQQHAPINNCYYDAGLLVDEDDKMYVAYGNGEISVAELGSDGLSQVRTQRVFTKSANISALEGSRFYKINGSYYITLTRPPNGQYVIRSTNGPFGPFSAPQPLVDRVRSPVGGAPHQGGFVQLQNGDWYYLAFADAYPGGRIPVLAPLTFGSDGFPRVELVNGGWGESYPYLDVPRPPRAMKPHTGVDTFAGPALAPEWEWNHNPDNTKWSAGGRLTLQTATVSNDLYKARNTLTRRILGPSSTATIVLDYSAMRDGDQAGLALFRDRSAWVGIKRSAGTARVVMVNDVNMDTSWNTTSIGTQVASANVSGGRIWLRVSADIRPGPNREARFFYSTDGSQFTTIGPAFTMTSDWQFFMGYRFGIFNLATQALGGSVVIESFSLTTP